jgi:hypothetical protein
MTSQELFKQFLRKNRIVKKFKESLKNNDWGNPTDLDAYLYIFNASKSYADTVYYIAHAFNWSSADNIHNIQLWQTMSKKWAIYWHNNNAIAQHSRHKKK